MDGKDEATDQYIRAAAALLGLPIETRWVPAVRTNLEVTLNLSKTVADFELPDEAEPASVFDA